MSTIQIITTNSVKCGAIRFFTSKVNCRKHYLLETVKHFRNNYRIYDYGSSGHIWQGTFKSFIIQNGVYSLMVLKYVNGNLVKAGRE